MATTGKLITNYAPDIYKALNGILLVYKPPHLSVRQLQEEIRERIAGSLNELAPRPLATKLKILGDIHEEKFIVERPNLADHPLVVGPRYLPWEMSLSSVKPVLGYRTSGLIIFLLGDANRYYRHKMNSARMVSIYHITGKFGYVTDNCHSDGKIIDKSTYHHIRAGRMDAALSRIESNQHERIFDAAAVPMHSQEAYELAKAWPSRPPKMADWPVIYRLRCIHLKLPTFKIEVTVVNETEDFLAHLCPDIGFMLKSGSFTESIRRVKQGPFNIDNCLTDKDWDLQSIINHLQIYNGRHEEILDILRKHKQAMSIKTDYKEPISRIQKVER